MCTSIRANSVRISSALQTSSAWQDLMIMLPSQTSLSLAATCVRDPYHKPAPSISAITSAIMSDIRRDIASPLSCYPRLVPGSPIHHSRSLSSLMRLWVVTSLQAMHSMEAGIMCKAAGTQTRATPCPVRLQLLSWRTCLFTCRENSNSRPRSRWRAVADLKPTTP
jgi:hypothetical protein